MDRFPGHPVPRIDDTVTRATLHERAEAVAVPNFNYLEQFVAGISDAFICGRRRARAHPSAGGTDPSDGEQQ